MWREKEFPLLYSENIAQKRIRTTLCKIHTLMTEFPPSPHHIPLTPIQPSAGSSCVTSFIIIHFGKINCRCEQFCSSRILSAFLYIVISTLAYSCTCIFSRKVVTAPQLRECPHALVFRWRRNRFTCDIDKSLSQLLSMCNNSKVQTCTVKGFFCSQNKPSLFIFATKVKRFKYYKITLRFPLKTQTKYTVL